MGDKNRDQLCGILGENPDLVAGEELVMKQAIPWRPKNGTWAEDRVDSYITWIRRNISKKKLQTVKDELKKKDYLNSEFQLIERVYRSIHRSLKIEFAYSDMLSFMDLISYLLLPDKQELVLQGSCKSPQTIQVQIEKDFKRCFPQKKNSRLWFYYIDVKLGLKRDVRKVGHFYDYDKIALKLIGASVTYYYITNSIVYIIDNIHKNPNYKFPRIMGMKEAIFFNILLESNL